VRYLIASVLALSVACTNARVEATPVPTPSSGAAARTAAPTATAEPTIRKKVGTAVQYDDGWKMTVMKFEEQAASRFSTPAPGNRYVKLTVRYDNGTPKEASYNVYDWKMQDSTGVRRSQTFALIDDSSALGSGKLAPGGFVTGSIIFELPVVERTAIAIYENYGYRQATWELF